VLPHNTETVTAVTVFHSVQILQDIVKFFFVIGLTCQFATLVSPFCHQLMQHLIDVSRFVIARKKPAGVVLSLLSDVPVFLRERLSPTLLTLQTGASLDYRPQLGAITSSLDATFEGFESSVILVVRYICHKCHNEDSIYETGTL